MKMDIFTKLRRAPSAQKAYQAGELDTVHVRLEAGPDHRFIWAGTEQDKRFAEECAAIDARYGDVQLVVPLRTLVALLKADLVVPDGWDD